MISGPMSFKKYAVSLLQLILLKRRESMDRLDRGYNGSCLHPEERSRNTPKKNRITLTFMAMIGIKNVKKYQLIHELIFGIFVFHDSK